MGFKIRVLRFRIRVLGLLGLYNTSHLLTDIQQRIADLGFRIVLFRFWIRVFGFRICFLGYRIRVLGFRIFFVSGLGLEFYGLGVGF